MIILRSAAMFTILPDRDIAKIAETKIVSAICSILPIYSMIPKGATL
jgi:hypothetical protein